MNQKELDPKYTILIVKHNEKEVGRIRASSKNAVDYVQSLGQQYGHIIVDYVEDESPKEVQNLLNRLF